MKQKIKEHKETESSIDRKVIKKAIKLKKEITDISEELSDTENRLQKYDMKTDFSEKQIRDSYHFAVNKYQTQANESLTQIVSFLYRLAREVELRGLAAAQNPLNKVHSEIAQELETRKYGSEHSSPHGISINFDKREVFH